MTSILVLSEAPFCLALVLQLALWSSALDHETRTARLLRALGAGIFFGWGVLIRPSWLLFLPFAAGFGLCIASAKRRQIEVAAVSLATSILILTPWWIRNFVVTGHVVPTTLQTGASLYDGLNPDATGASDMQFVEDFLEDEKKDPSGEGSLEYRLNKRMTAESLTWVSENPQEAVRLAGVKFLRMWNIFPNEPSFSSLSTRLLLALTYAPVLVLGLYGAVSNFQRGYSYMLCWLPAVYFSLLHMVFIGSIRYRQPAMLGLIVLAAGTVATWIARSRKAESGHHAG